MRLNETLQKHRDCLEQCQMEHDACELDHDEKTCDCEKEKCELDCDFDYGS